MTTVIPVRLSVSLPWTIGAADASAPDARDEPVVKASELRVDDLRPVESDEHAARREIAARAAASCVRRIQASRSAGAWSGMTKSSGQRVRESVHSVRRKYVSCVTRTLPRPLFVMRIQ